MFSVAVEWESWIIKRCSSKNLKGFADSVEADGFGVGVSVLRGLPFQRVERFRHVSYLLTQKKRPSCQWFPWTVIKGTIHLSSWNHFIFCKLDVIFQKCNHFATFVGLICLFVLWNFRFPVGIILPGKLVSKTDYELLSPMSSIFQDQN